MASTSKSNLQNDELSRHGMPERPTQSSSRRAGLKKVFSTGTLDTGKRGGNKKYKATLNTSEHSAGASKSRRNLALHRQRSASTLPISSDEDSDSDEEFSIAQSMAILTGGSSRHDDHSNAHKVIDQKHNTTVTSQGDKQVHRDTQRTKERVLVSSKDNATVLQDRFESLERPASSRRTGMKKSESVGSLGTRSRSSKKNMAISATGNMTGTKSKRRSDGTLRRQRSSGDLRFGDDDSVGGSFSITQSLAVLSGDDNVADWENLKASARKKSAVGASGKNKTTSSTVAGQLSNHQVDKDTRTTLGREVEYEMEAPVKTSRRTGLKKSASSGSLTAGSKKKYASTLDGSLDSTTRDSKSKRNLVRQRSAGNLPTRDDDSDDEEYNIAQSRAILVGGATSLEGDATVADLEALGNANDRKSPLAVPASAMNDKTIPGKRRKKSGLKKSASSGSLGAGSGRTMRQNAATLDTTGTVSSAKSKRNLIRQRSAGDLPTDDDGSDDEEYSIARSMAILVGGSQQGKDTFLDLEAFGAKSLQDEETSPNTPASSSESTPVESGEKDDAEDEPFWGWYRILTLIACLAIILGIAAAVFFVFAKPSSDINATSSAILSSEVPTLAPTPFVAGGSGSGQVGGNKNDDSTIDGPPPPSSDDGSSNSNVSSGGTNQGSDNDNTSDGTGSGGTPPPPDDNENSTGNSVNNGTPPPPQDGSSAGNGGSSNNLPPTPRPTPPPTPRPTPPPTPRPPPPPTLPSGGEDGTNDNVFEHETNVCGNGIVDADEECDYGNGPSRTRLRNGGSYCPCTTDCRFKPRGSQRPNDIFFDLYVTTDGDAENEFYYLGGDASLLDTMRALENAGPERLQVVLEERYNEGSVKGSGYLASTDTTYRISDYLDSTKCYRFVFWDYGNTSRDGVFDKVNYPFAKVVLLLDGVKVFDDEDYVTGGDGAIFGNC